MSNAAQLRAKYNANCVKYGPMSRKVYKRVTTKSGGDALIHRPGTVTKTDTELSPQPLYTIVAKQIVFDNNKRAEVGDYEIGISADAISLADLQDKTTSLVLKDSAGNEEPLRIVHFSPAELGGEFIAFQIFATGRS